MPTPPKKPEGYDLAMKAVRSAMPQLSEEQARAVLQLEGTNVAALEARGLDLWATEATETAAREYANSPQGLMEEAKRITDARRERDEQIAAAKTILSERTHTSEAVLSELYSSDELLVAAGLAEPPPPAVRRDKPVPSSRAELAHTDAERAYLAQEIAKQDARIAERGQS
jgi:hypothetical protein